MPTIQTRESREIYAEKLMELNLPGSTVQELAESPKRSSSSSRAGWKIMVLALLASTVFDCAAVDSPSPIRIETLAKSTSSWDGAPYRAYFSGQPQLTVLKITIDPRTTLKWHYHPVPNAAYILSDDLTLEKKDGNKKHFIAGQALTETVDSIHRGITGADPAVLIVF
jgi:quercetin dioxygenase-like cupin family protein